MNAQDAAIAKLEAEGWSFRTWIDGSDGGTDVKTAVLTKHPQRGVTHYAEVDFDGTVSL